MGNFFHILDGVPPVLVLLIGLAAVFVGIIVFLAIFGVLTAQRQQVSKSLAAVQAYSAAPPEMRTEVDRSFGDRIGRPFMAWLSKIGHSFTPADQARRMQTRLDIAGNPPGWNVDRMVGLKMLGLLVGIVGSIIVTMLIAVPIGWMLVICVGVTLGGFFAPNLWIYQKGYDRMQQMRRDLPDSIDLLTISVEAGLAFDGALARVARETEGPVAGEFARVLQETNIGVARATALRNLSERTQLAELKTFVTALVQADSFGIPLAQVLRVQSRELRTKRKQRAEELAQRVPIKILFPLLFCILPTLIVAVLGPGVIMIAKSLFGVSG